MATQAEILELILRLKTENESVLSDLGASIGKLSKAAGPLLATGAGAAAVAVGAIGASALDAATDVDAAQRLIQQQLGVTADEAAALGEQAQAVFATGITGSVTDAAGALVIVRQQMQGVADTDLAGVAVQATQLAGVLGTDVAGVTNAANTLMEQFGLTSEQAFNFMAEGQQRGLNNSGDFLDSIGEYSTQFANGGATAEQFFSTLETGMAGGVLGTDKAADAFKEFRLRIQDGSQATADGLALLGINADEFSAKLASGEITAADAFNTIITKINETEDPTIRLQAGAALIGTQFEDLGDSAFEGLNLAQTSLEDMDGAMDGVSEASGSLGQDWQAIMNEMKLALLPLGQELLALAKEYMPDIRNAVVWFADATRENLPPTIEFFKWLFREVSEGAWVVGQGVENVQKFFSDWFTDVQEGAAVVRQVFADIQAAIQPMLDKFAEFRDAAANIQLPDWLTPGSPTPFETGLWGIQDALDSLNQRGLPDLSAGLDVTAPPLPTAGAFAAGVGGGAATIINNITLAVEGSVLTEGELVEKIRRGLIDFGNRNVTTGIS